MPKIALGEGSENIFTMIKAGTESIEQKFCQLPLSQIVRNVNQPRKTFIDDTLDELAASIKNQGLLQPIIVKPTEQGTYEIVAGERRWRAAKIAGLETVPALVKDFDDRVASAVSLIENIQREDLNPMEEARAYKNLCEQYRMTHAQVAELVGKSRSAVSNSLRLLDLDDSLQQQVMEGQLSAGHVKALLAIPEEKRGEAARHISDHQLNVREAEAFAKNARLAEETVEAHTDLNQDLTQLEKKLSRLFDAKVTLTQAGLRIRLHAEFPTCFELDSVVQLLEKS